MRVRSVNEKAVEKLITYLKNLKLTVTQGTNHNLSNIHKGYGVSNSSLTAVKKLEIIVNSEGFWIWNNSFDADRKTAIKILEFLRQRSDRQTDKPISDEWVVSINEIKQLLGQLVDNTKKNESRLDGLNLPQIRFETARMFATSLVSGKPAGHIDDVAIDVINFTAIRLTEDLLRKFKNNYGEKFRVYLPNRYRWKVCSQTQRTGTAI